MKSPFVSKDRRFIQKCIRELVADNFYDAARKLQEKLNDLETQAASKAAKQVLRPSETDRRDL